MAFDRPSVITIGRQMGSGGTYLGQRVARRLGYAYLDREILRLAAEKLQVSVEDLARRDQRVQSYWDRFFQAFSFGTPEGPYTPPPPALITDEQLLRVQREIIRETAARGACVVVGHGACRLLRNQPGALHVFVHAAADFRAQRIMQVYGLSSCGEALRMIEHADQEREDYFRLVLGASWCDARNYHLCLDTGRLGLEEAERLVLSLVMPHEGETPHILPSQ